MFIDEAKLTVRAGKGGNGCVAFRREKFVPRGGPSGGDGGRGGSVILAADGSLQTLMDIPQRTVYQAENGRPGEGSNKQGRKGADCTLKVPVGTIVRDADEGIILKDLAVETDQCIVARGGRAGKGNKHFASATNRTPREATSGNPGQERRLALELRLVADVGIIGLPNAGKSTLISRLSSAHPKIADYPFTTLDPVLGIVEGPGFQRCVMVDIPGLVEGAHDGVGLGHQFLRHVARTRLLLHMVDILPIEGDSDPEHDYHVVRRELAEYNPDLAARREIVVASKIDLLGGDDARLREFAQVVGQTVIGISSVTGTGLEQLRRAVFAQLDDMDDER